MVDRDRRDDRERRVREHVGRVEPAAEAGLEQSHVGGRPREAEQGGRRGHLEEGDRLIAVNPLAFTEQFGERVLFDQRAGQADAFVEAHHMRRSVDVDAVAGGLERGAHIGDDRALAVGARDMDRRRQRPIGVAERGEQALDPVEREIDQLGMEREQALEKDVTLQPGAPRFRRSPHRLPRAGYRGRATAARRSRRSAPACSTARE